ncbi:MAG: hypothetical protein ABSE46_25585 [Terracidiphilus sp.]|jgi:hypothetical protein
MNISHTIPLHEGFNVDLNGDFFNIFNHGEDSIEYTTLAAGIVSDQLENNGVNNFANMAPNGTRSLEDRGFRSAEKQRL